MESHLLRLSELGVWDIISLMISVVPALAVLVFIIPRSKIKGLYIDPHLAGVSEFYPKVIAIELRNRTNSVFYIRSEGFEFKKNIRPAENAAKDVSSNTYEVKFPGRNNLELTEVDTIIRQNETLTTWVPVDPSQSEYDIKRALGKRAVGTLVLTVQEVSVKPSRAKKLRCKV